MTFFTKLIDNVMQERIRTSVMAVVITGWVFVNHVGIINFILSDNEIRKIIVANYTLWDVDLIWILIYFLLYTALVSFVFPFLSLKINHFKIRFIIEKQEEQDKNNKERNYKNKGYLSLAREKSTPSYAKKLIDKELENWEEKKKELQKTNDSIIQENKKNHERGAIYDIAKLKFENDLTKLNKVNQDLLTKFKLQKISYLTLKNIDSISSDGDYLQWKKEIDKIIPSLMTLNIDPTSGDKYFYGEPIEKHHRSSYQNEQKRKINVQLEEIDNYISSINLSYDLKIESKNNSALIFE